VATMRPCTRCATLNGYVGLAQSLGLDPARLLSRVGLDVADLAVPDRWIPAVSVARVLELSAAESGREDFGLQLAQLRRLSTLGPLSVVLRDEPDLRGALQLLIGYDHSYNEALRGTLTEANGRATISWWLALGEPAPTRQALELAVAAVLGLIRGLRVPQWQPLSVCFTHSPPADMAAHRRLLGPSIRFEQEFTGVIVAAHELNSVNTMADPADPLMRDYTRVLLQTLPPPPRSELTDRVRESVEVLLPLHHFSMSQIARGLGMTKRTLYRQLEAERESFVAIVNETRAGLAERNLANDRYSLTDISGLLCFSAPSAFSRWFHRQFGVSPTEWREAAGRAREQSPADEAVGP